MTIGADFDLEHVAFDGRAGGEIVSAGAMDCYGVIVGMNTGFHEAPFVASGLHGLPVLGEKGLTPRGERATAASLGRDANPSIRASCDISKFGENPVLGEPLAHFEYHSFNTQFGIAIP